jgi:hypothetical protein
MEVSMPIIDTNVLSGDLVDTKSVRHLIVERVNTTAHFTALNRVRGEVSCLYIPFIVDSKAVEFDNIQCAVEFLQSLTNTPTQTDWDERYGGYRDGEGLETSYAIRAVVTYATANDVLSKYAHEQKQRALRELSPAQRKALGLPEPE